jgi:hypothetical protein
MMTAFPAGQGVLPLLPDPLRTCEEGDAYEVTDPFTLLYR